MPKEPQPHIPSPITQPLSVPQVQQQTTPIQAYQRIHTHPRALVPNDVSVLQRTVGNQAIQRLLARHGQGQMNQPEQETPAFRQNRENTTGLPDRLKATLEAHSGISMDDVHVHYHSSHPTQLQALAYTQGTDIHVGPGQEKHLAHEAWHVAQQKQGRVKPIMQMKGMALNHDAQLEQEADAFSVHYDQYTGPIHIPMLVDPTNSVTHATAQFQMRNEENIKLLEQLLQSLGIPPSSDDYIKILYHVIHSYYDDEIEDAKQYIWNMARRFRAPETSEFSFEPLGHPRRALLHTMGASSQTGAQHLYHGMYRQTFERLPQEELLPPDLYLNILNRVANRYANSVRFAPQGRENESFRAHYEQASHRPDTPEGQFSAKLLREVQAVRILARNPPPGQRTFARITLTLNPLLLEFALTTLTDLFTRHPVIKDFKVMGANTLGRGPDDVVIYLSDLISSNAVRALIADLSRSDLQCWQQNQRGFLRRSTPPIGMQQLDSGIYGADMPGAEELNRQAQGSHGMNMALVMSQVLTSNMPREQAFARFFGSAELNIFNPAYSNVLSYDNLRLRMGQAIRADMNGFLDAIVLVAQIDRGHINIIAQNLRNVDIRDIGEMREIHSEAMNAVVAQIGMVTRRNVTVRIISLNPFNGSLMHIDIGNGDSRVYIFYSHQQFSPLFRV